MSKGRGLILLRATAAPAAAAAPVPAFSPFPLLPSGTAAELLSRPDFLSRATLPIVRALPLKREATGWVKGKTKKHHCCFSLSEHCGHIVVKYSATVPNLACGLMTHKMAQENKSSLVYKYVYSKNRLNKHKGETSKHKKIHVYIYFLLGWVDEDGVFEYQVPEISLFGTLIHGGPCVTSVWE